MDRELALEVVRVTESAALASAKWLGRGKKNEADNAATSAMRAMFDSISIHTTQILNLHDMVFGNGVKGETKKWI